MNYKKIVFNDNSYIILQINHKNKKIPVILDEIYFDTINKLNKTWKINDVGFVVSTHVIDNQEIEINMHDIIMRLYNKRNKLKDINKNILHINRLGFDNRKENLMYDTINKEIGKNLRKKKRIIDLEDRGIDVDNIPSFMWYMKPNDTHDERFFINISDIQWKTTSSSKLSLKYKLEEGKKFLRELKELRPEIFEENSMNGELNSDGKKLLQSFFDISKQAGFKNLKTITTDNITDKYLKQNLRGLSAYEKKLLNDITFYDKIL